MQQRADLIKLYVDGGIANIKEIRKHYNSFATGGPVEEGKDFLKEWYSSPTTQNMVEQVAPNNNIDINQTIESIKEFEATSNIPDEGLPALVKGINYFNLDKYVDRDVYRTNRKQALADAFTGSNIGAFYSRPHNSVVYQYGYYNPTNQVHEIDHGIQNAIPEISTPAQPVEQSGCDLPPV